MSAYCLCSSDSCTVRRDWNNGKVAVLFRLFSKLLKSVQNRLILQEIFHRSIQRGEGDENSKISMLRSSPCLCQTSVYYRVRKYAEWRTKKSRVCRFMTPSPLRVTWKIDEILMTLTEATITMTFIRPPSFRSTSITVFHKFSSLSVDSLTSTEY